MKLITVDMATYSGNLFRKETKTKHVSKIMSLKWKFRPQDYHYPYWLLPIINSLLLGPSPPPPHRTEQKKFLSFGMFPSLFFLDDDRPSSSNKEMKVNIAVARTKDKLRWPCFGLKEKKYASSFFMLPSPFSHVIRYFWIQKKGDHCWNNDYGYGKFIRWPWEHDGMNIMEIPGIQLSISCWIHPNAQSFVCRYSTAFSHLSPLSFILLIKVHHRRLRSWLKAFRFDNEKVCSTQYNMNRVKSNFLRRRKTNFLFLHWFLLLWMYCVTFFMPLKSWCQNYSSCSLRELRIIFLY